MVIVKLQTPFRFILVGLMNMIMVRSLTTNFLTDITQFLLAHGDVALTKITQNVVVASLVVLQNIIL
jgi:hypothetical protein